MGKTKRTALRTVAVVSAILAMTSCTSGAPDREEPSTQASAPTTVAAESMDRLGNRLVALTDLQGRALYVVPEGQTRNEIDALAKQPLFEKVYTPAECAPETGFEPPPPQLEGVFGRSNISEDQSSVRVWIYTAPDEAALVEYFVGSDPLAPARCTDFEVTTNGVSQNFSYTSVDSPPVAPHSQSVQYSVTQDGATTHHLRVAAVNGTVAATVTLSTTNPADQAMKEAVLNLAQQATI